MIYQISSNGGAALRFRTALRLRSGFPASPGPGPRDPGWRGSSTPDCSSGDVIEEVASVDWAPRQDPRRSRSASPDYVATEPGRRTQSPAGVASLYPPSHSRYASRHVSRSVGRDHRYRHRGPCIVRGRHCRLRSRLRSADDPPDEVGIEFGVQLSAQTGAFIASVAAEANFNVSMTWRRSADSG
jgi:Trypsin-co-occurring domain 1